MTESFLQLWSMWKPLHISSRPSHIVRQPVHMIYISSNSFMTLHIIFSNGFQCCTIDKNTNNKEQGKKTFYWLFMNIKNMKSKHFMNPFSLFTWKLASYYHVRSVYSHCNRFPIFYHDRWRKTLCTSFFSMRIICIKSV